MVRIAYHSMAFAALYLKMAAGIECENQQENTIMICAFCQRDASELPQLVAGPEGNNICSECASTIAENILQNKKTLKHASACSFCGKSDHYPHGLGSKGGTTICCYCIELSLEIMSSQSNLALVDKLQEYLKFK